MLTSRSAEEDIVAGLSAGADYYVIKPVATAILVARVNALARRAYPPPTGGIETFGDLSFDTRNRSEEHTSELQSLMRISYAVFCLKKKKLLKTKHKHVNKTTEKQIHTKYTYYKYTYS